MTEIRLYKPNFNTTHKTAEIFTEGRGSLIIGDKKYTIYDHFKRMDITHRFGMVGVDVRIILTDGNSFEASMNSETYDKSHEIMMKKQRDEYCGGE